MQPNPQKSRHERNKRKYTFNNPLNLKEAARRAGSRFNYCSEDDLAVVWQFIEEYPTSMPRHGDKVALYTKPFHLKGIIVFSNSVDDIQWESEWEEGFTYHNRWVCEKKLLTRLENFDINNIEVS